MSKMNFVMLAAGVAVGATVSWFWLKKHYEEIAQEEIDSVKAVFANRNSTVQASEAEEDNQRKADIAKLKPDLVNYVAKLQEEGYTNYSEHSKKASETQKEEVNTPYVISPEAFEESENYMQVSLTYYSDGVLADDNNDVVEDAESVVGADFAKHFGEFEEDAVFVRNDLLRCDYEILKDNHTYADAVGDTRY